MTEYKLKLFAQTPATKSALAFSAKGYAIIPLSARSKKPFERGLSNPFVDREELKAFLSNYPDLNYGIVTGGASGLYVLDIDGDEGRESLKRFEAEHGSLPTTVRVLTGRGEHRYFHGNLALRCSASRLAPGLDMRADGGYVVGPGSVHETGHIYWYAPGGAWRDTGMAPLPPAIIAGLKRPADNHSAKAAAKPVEVAPQSVGMTIAEGHRNVELTSLAGKLHNTGLSENALQGALSAHNQEQCCPPLDEAEVLKIAQSVNRMPIHGGMTTDEGEQVTAAVLLSRFAEGDHLLFTESGDFYCFEQTHWRLLTIPRLEGQIFATIQQMPPRKGQSTVGLVKQAVQLLKAKCARVGDPLRFRSDPSMMLNFQNGELWIADDGALELKPHSFRSYSRHLFNVHYDPQAKCPRYDQALAEIFAEANDPVALADYWDRLCGYALQPRRPHPHIIIGIGEGSNGKTALLRILIAVLGEDLVAAMPIQEIERSRFTLAGLDGKHVLVDDDVKAGTKLPDGELKKLSEEKLVTAEKKFGPPYQFKVRTLPILLANNPPTIAELSYGLRRRLQVIPFERIFEDGEADPGLVAYIKVNELSGVLNRLLYGFTKVMRSDWRLDPPADVKRATEEFIEGANPLPKFIAEKCEKKGSVLVRILYEYFEAYCAEANIKFVQQRIQFGRNLERLTYNVQHTKEGDRVFGLSLRPSPASPASH